MACIVDIPNCSDGLFCILLKWTCVCSVYQAATATTPQQKSVVSLLVLQISQIILCYGCS